MNVPRRHHYIPNFYLRQFADKKRRVRVYDRYRGGTYTANTNKAAVETRFYDLMGPDGSLDTRAEEALAQLEGAAKASLDRLTNGAFPPTDEDRDVISLFAASLLTRTPETRDSVAAMRDELRAHLRGYEMADNEIDDVLRRSGAFELDQNDLVHLSFNVAPELAPYLRDRTWLLGESRAGGLITSDHPIVSHSDSPEPFDGVGVGNADAVYFPLGPAHLLILAHPSLGFPERTVALMSEDVLAEQRLVASASYELVFQHPAEPALPSGVVPDMPRPLFSDGAGRPTFSSKHTSIG